MHRLNNDVLGLSEFLAETRTLCLVPFARFKHFVFGLRPEDHLSRHAQPSSLRRTSDQGGQRLQMSRAPQ